MYVTMGVLGYNGLHIALAYSLRPGHDLASVMDL